MVILVNFIGVLRNINAFLERAAFAIGMVIVAIIVLALFLSAVTRFISGNGYDWLIELPPVLICWLVFPLLGPLLRKRQHINVNVLGLYISNRWKTLARFVNSLIAFVAAGIFLKAGYDATLLYYRMGQILEIELEIPVWWMYLAFPTGFLILLLFSFELLVSDLYQMLKN